MFFLTKYPNLRGRGVGVLVDAGGVGAYYESKFKIILFYFYFIFRGGGGGG